MLKLDWNLLFTIINLLVLFFILKKFLFSRVLDVIEKRENLIKENFAKAEEMDAQAKDLKIQYEEKLEKAETEASKILEESQKRAKAYYDRTVLEAQAQSAKILQTAKEDIKIQEENILKEAKEEITMLAGEMSKKLSGSKSSYDQFLDDMNGKNDEK